MSIFNLNNCRLAITLTGVSPAKSLVTGIVCALVVSCSTLSPTTKKEQGLSGMSKIEVQNAIVSHYADLGEAIFAASYQDALDLQVSIKEFLKAPSAAGLLSARDSWKQARVAYLQSEAFRFGNALVDEWEPRVNSWPLDEGLIDYVSNSYGTESDSNFFYTANVIANPLIDEGGVVVDAASITPQLLAETLHQLDGVDANVATGYHAIEFLLWGQDLNGTQQGAGERPWTDYSLEACTSDNCDRRRNYLEAATDLLINDLQDMSESWQRHGSARTDLIEKGVAGGLATMLTGMGSLAYGELAGERIRLGLLLHDPEEEQDCFSDNTHWSHYYDVLGIANVYFGTFTHSGKTVHGPSLEALLRTEYPVLHAEMNARMEEAMSAVRAMAERGEAGEPYDMLIASGNEEGELIINRTVTALMELTRTIEKVIAELGLQNVSIEGSSSLPTT